MPVRSVLEVSFPQMRWCAWLILFAEAGNEGKTHTPFFSILEGI